MFNDKCGNSFDSDDFGLLWFPSMRGIAYLNVLRAMNKQPKVIVALVNKHADIPGFTEEANNNNYSSHYFDVNYSLEEFATKFDIPILFSSAENINDIEIASILNKLSTKDWLFTGGGILNKNLFTNGRRYLHIHPGKLPEYRGSTCFYYSLLKENSLAATAFFLTPALDKGNVLVTCHFKLNMKLDEKHNYFMDYILDPWIRAQTLKSFLLANEREMNNSILVDQEDSTIGRSKPKEGVDRTYYVMHPLLRALTINKINQCFNKRQAKGVFLIE